MREAWREASMSPRDCARVRQWFKSSGRVEVAFRDRAWLPKAFRAAGKSIGFDGADTVVLKRRFIVVQSGGGQGFLTIFVQFSTSDFSKTVSSVLIPAHAIHAVLVGGVHGSRGGYKGAFSEHAS